MRWLKRDRWKADIAFAGLLLLLALMVWVPASAGAYEGVLGIATPSTVQATPTVDVTATITALNEEKLRQEIQQLKNQNDPDLLDWFRMNAAIFLSTLVVVIGGLIGLFRWFGDRRSERGKRDEERFQTAIERLGSSNQATQVGAAITLRTFLDSGYERFYGQIFDLAVAHLRLRKVDQINAEPIDSLSQALITIFKESFLKVRPRPRWIDGILPGEAMHAEQQLNAAYIQLDTAYLANVDLRYAWMLEAYLREADLSKADLRHAVLRKANLRKAKLIEANLFKANLRGANLSGADLKYATLIKTDLWGADLREANLSGADLREAKLRSEATYNEGFFFFTAVKYGIGFGYLNKAILFRANLSGTDLSETNFRDADLREANLSGADLSGARFRHANLNGADLSGAHFTEADLDRTNLEDAQSLKDTDLRGVKGLTKEQLVACKAKGAIIDEDSTISSSQSLVSPPPPSQSNYVQTPSTPPAQVNTLTPSTDGSSAASSEPSSQS